ncbi:MAG: TPMT family class I SAM-dependent methyltransferase [Chloroflexota bacterium]|nr:TPMT family class I SAM-dependent methyltransferase [Chloroflexota bacterium]MDQ5866845.1 TPMT family class I SAM-dependent methyltransferase [Chloroflexota bacterium]
MPKSLFEGDHNEAEFWERHYQEGNTAWDLGAPAPPFVDLLAEQVPPEPGSMLVLGAGRGHDALLFARHGFEVRALDFAESAVRETQEAARSAGLPVTTAQHDFFALPPGYDASFDYVLEHTFFSAIDPDRRGEYVRIVRRLLKPGGLFIALFYAHGRPGGPPFTTSEDEVRALFGRDFVIERLEVPVRSVKPRQGLELLALMRSGYHQEG